MDKRMLMLAVVNEQSDLKTWCGAEANRWDARAREHESGARPLGPDDTLALLKSHCSMLRRIGGLQFLVELVEP